MKFKCVAQQENLAYDQHTLQRRTMYLKNLKEGKKYIEEIKEDRETKSQKQCGAIFGCLVPAIQTRMTDMGLGICGVAPS